MTDDKKPRRRKRDTPKPPPLTEAQRRAASNKAKATAGEKRITTWIPKDGAQALQRLKDDGRSGATDREILNNALLGLAHTLGLADDGQSKDS